MKSLILSIMLLTTLVVVSCAGNKKVETSKNGIKKTDSSKNNEIKFSSEASKLCFTKGKAVVSKNNHFFIIVKGTAGDFDDEKMSISESYDNCRMKLSFFNGDFLKKFAVFILENKGKNIGEKTEEISKNKVKKEYSKNTEFIEKLTRSRFRGKDENFFDMKVINGSYISCMMYDVESSVFDKLKASKYEMSKKDLHDNFVEFLKNSKYKSTKIK